MTYAVKETFYSVQGEGVNAGRPAVFCRFAGCNLWSGSAPDRRTAICRFCDTSFVGVDGPSGGHYPSAKALARLVASKWPRERPGLSARRFAVFTGGEPLLQLDQPLIDAMHALEFEIAVETNGTRPVPATVDWITVSPKAGAPLVQRSGNELKLVYPQPGAEPEQFEDLGFDHFILQPMDGDRLHENRQLAARYCLDHPRWRLSLQIQKILGLP